MSKNTYFTHFAKLNETEELEIEVRYSLGETNSWWDGKPRPRGLRVNMTPVRRKSHGDYTSKTMRLGDDRGRSFHIVDLKRKSPKQGERLAQFVEQRIEDIAAHAVVQDWQGVAEILVAYE